MCVDSSVDRNRHSLPVDVKREVVLDNGHTVGNTANQPGAGHTLQASERDNECSRRKSNMKLINKKLDNINGSLLETIENECREYFSKVTREDDSTLRLRVKTKMLNPVSDVMVK